LAVLSFFAAIGIAMVSLPGFHPARHPLALLGAVGVPGALLFNVLGWCVPGLLASLLVVVLQRACGQASAAARVGLHMLLLGAVAFTALGVFPLQVEALDGPQSQLHASVWMIWALAWIAGSGLLAFGLRGAHAWAALVRMTVMTAAVIGVAAFALPSLLPAPVAQDIAFLAWAGWLLGAAPLARLR